MPIIDGVKWACNPCMRGHRSSKCAHSDRVLIRVRKPGRPLSSCPHTVPNAENDGFVHADATDIAEGGGRGCGCHVEVTSVAIPKAASCHCGSAQGKHHVHAHANGSTGTSSEDPPEKRGSKSHSQSPTDVGSPPPLEPASGAGVSKRGARRKSSAFASADGTVKDEVANRLLAEVLDGVEEHKEKVGDAQNSHNHDSHAGGNSYSQHLQQQLQQHLQLQQQQLQNGSTGSDGFGLSAFQSPYAPPTTSAMPMPPRPSFMMAPPTNSTSTTSGAGRSCCSGKHQSSQPQPQPQTAAIPPPPYEASAAFSALGSFYPARPAPTPLQLFPPYQPLPDIPSRQFTTDQSQPTIPCMLTVEEKILIDHIRAARAAQIPPAPNPGPSHAQTHGHAHSHSRPVHQNSIHHTSQPPPSPRHNAKTVNGHSVNGCHPQPGNVGANGDQDCACGDSCQCIGCKDHPYNPAMVGWVHSLNLLAPLSPDTTSPAASTPTPAPASSCCSGRNAQRSIDAHSHSANNGGRNVSGGPGAKSCCESNPRVLFGLDMDMDMDLDMDMASNGNASGGASIAASTPEDTQLVADPGMFYTFDYPGGMDMGMGGTPGGESGVGGTGASGTAALNECATNKDACTCGDGCECIGCLMHGMFENSPPGESARGGTELGSGGVG